jgi:hypothetical protein
LQYVLNSNCPSEETLTAFFQQVGEQLTTSAHLQLLGGSSLAMLGYERPTYDVDFVGAEHESTPFRVILENVARQMELEIEPVPIAEFIPLPPDGGCNAGSVCACLEGNRPISRRRKLSHMALSHRRQPLLQSIAEIEAGVERG